MFPTIFSLALRDAGTKTQSGSSLLIMTIMGGAVALIIMGYIADFSKTYPSFLTLKEGSTFLTKPLFPQEREDVTALRCSEPQRSKVGGASKPSPYCAGWDRQDATGDTTSTAFDVVQKELKYLGLWKFAGAVMYVLHEALGLSEENMIAPIDEKRGKLLLA